MTEFSVPFLDLGKINARVRADIDRAFADVLNSNRYLLGMSNEGFAADFASLTGTMHCVPVANGLDALRLSLKAWMTLGRIREGDEVVVPANSFIASALAVSDSGLSLRLADVDPETFCVTRDSVAAALTRRTRVIMPVHLYGRIGPMAEIMDLAQQRDLLVLEDSAQAHGATLAGRSAGALGDAGAFSFYPSKNLGALGDAGCVVTDDPDLAERLRMLANYGSIAKYEHDQLGVNSRMDEIHAAVLAIKLRGLLEDNSRRREIATFYNARIAHPDVLVPAPPVDPLSHVWHLYVVRTSDRTGLARHLLGLGVETSIHYPVAIHRQKPYQSAFSNVHLPVAERLQGEVLSLPMSQVMTDEQAELVVSAINAWPGRAAR